MQCPSCAAENLAGSRFCSSCGQVIGSPSDLATSPAGLAAGPVVAAVRVGRLVSSDSIPVGGLTPGAILADRYRIIGLLGRGGMGEVYRADDLKLGQAVALKFLPRELSADAVRRERFFAEVRITRQLAHPNICRVYDIGETNGQHFLSMEFIDGEDLASLVMRIGYLSNEKALDIARQLVAGLAAAHERGVLHRDLKPANIMIDGHGRVRITDFGLAIAATEEASQSGDVSGTPAYMAPEQLAGKGTSVRSDIYALGLVLYEILTGKRAFTAATIADLRNEKERSTPAAPSEIRSGIDPVVERLIMRCLERDPRARPSSVAQLAAALPGGDPLAAAIAAGETPSPELLIASGPTEGLRPVVAATLLAIVIAGALAAVALNDRVGLVSRAHLTKSPEALAERARAILKKAGYPEESNDHAFGFYADNDVVQYVSTKGSERRSSDLRAFGAVRFFYRQSPTPLVSVSVASGVDPGDPPLQQPGDVEIRVDGEGRLRTLQAVPTLLDPDPALSSAPDWPALFAEAGLDVRQWMPIGPQSIPPFYADTRAAWQGSLPDAPSAPVRIEAAAYRGRPIAFDILGPWTAQASSVTLRSGAPASVTLGTVVLFAILIGGGLFFARQNLRIGRGDRRGATRLTLFVLATWTLAWVLIEHHVAAAGEGLLYLVAAGTWLTLAGTLWTFYIAVEPFVRRRWPHILVSWTRLLSGDWRDALVGRDVLIGCTVGVVAVCLDNTNRLAAVSIARSEVLQPPDWNMFNGPSSFVGAVLGQTASAIALGLALLFFLFVLRVVLRRDWATAAAFALGSSLFAVSRSVPASWAFVPLALVAGVLDAFVLTRIGLLAMIIRSLLGNLLFLGPITLQASAWYASVGYVSFAIVAAIALYGFKTSLGGRPVLAAIQD
jgi:serine/threonine protein kinase